MSRAAFVLLVSLLTACGYGPRNPIVVQVVPANSRTGEESTADGNGDIPADDSPTADEASAPPAPATPDSASAADVLAVEAAGTPGAYTFSVQVASADTGCGQYADWWEVLDEEGRLLYRRVLLHSHVSEQPFRRSGGPVPAQPEQALWVRAHMHPEGYVGTVMRGSVAAGFSVDRMADGFAAGVEEEDPLPTGGAF